MRRASKQSAHAVALQSLVEIISAISECARSKVFGLSLTAQEHSDVSTNHILTEIREEFQVFMADDDLPRLTSEAHELDDMRNIIEVAFAIDQILRRSQDEGRV